MILLFSLLAVLAFVLAARYATDEGFSYEGRWNTLGAGDGGFTFSRPLVMLLVGLVFAGISCALLLNENSERLEVKPTHLHEHAELGDV